MDDGSFDGETCFNSTLSQNVNASNLWAYNCFCTHMRIFRWDLHATTSIFGTLKHKYIFICIYTQTHTFDVHFYHWIANDILCKTKTWAFSMGGRRTVHQISYIHLAIGALNGSWFWFSWNSFELALKYMSQHDWVDGQMITFTDSKQWSIKTK